MTIGTANLIIATGENAEGCSIGAGSEASTMPATNLLTMQPSSVWRATDLASAYLEIDQGSAKAFNCVALIGHNGSSAATWRIRAATTQANLTASPGYDSGSVSMYGGTFPTGWDVLNALLFLSTAETYRWVRIDISDASNADGYFEAGRLILDNAWQPTVNMQFGWSLGWEDPSPIDEALGGQAWPAVRPKRRIVSLALDFETEDEMMTNAFEIDRKRGQSKDVMIALDPDATTHLHRYVVQGLLINQAPIVNSEFAVFRKPYQLRELPA